MNNDEYSKLTAPRAEDHSVSVFELLNTADRTLLYGYTFERKTVHVYLKGGLIHFFSGGNHHAQVTWHDASALVPNKRVYPALSDYEFSSILKAKGVDISFTTFGRELEPGDVYAGDIA